MLVENLIRKLMLFPSNHIVELWELHLLFMTFSHFHIALLFYHIIMLTLNSLETYRYHTLYFIDIT